MIYYKELAHMIIEAEKPHILPSVVQAGEPDKPMLWFWELESWWCKYQLLVEDGCLSSDRQCESPVCLFVLFWPSCDWLMPTHAGEDSWLYLVQKQDHRHTQKKCFIQAPTVPVKLTHEINHPNESPHWICELYLTRYICFILHCMPCLVRIWLAAGA